ncbi:MAG: GNAT family protein [Pseudomonadota bacterium]
MPKLDQLPLESPNLRAELFTKAHAAYFPTDDAVRQMWTWMPRVKGVSTVEGYIAHVLEMQRTGQIVCFSLRLKSDGQFAGIIGFVDISALHRQVRLGIAWHPTNMRLTTVYQEAELMMIQRAYDWRAKRLTWHVDPRNKGAMRAMKWIGATREARLRQYMRTADGGWADLVVFSMLRLEMKSAIEWMTAELESVPSDACPMLAVQKGS